MLPSRPHALDPEFVPDGAQAPEADPARGGGNEGDPAPAVEHHSQICPTCGHRLAGHRCKLICEQCGYYLSCADYY